MADRAPWGWKDPRNSLTVPFWRQLIPGLKVVVCLRNPHEAARSLARCGYSSALFSARLWSGYHERILAAVPQQNSILTHYDAFFWDAAAELRRLLSFLDLPRDEQKINSAIPVAKLNPRNDRSTSADLSDFRDDPEAMGLYSSLCAQAGPVFLSSLSGQAGEIKSEPWENKGQGIPSLDDRWNIMEQTVKEFTERAGEQERAVQALTAQVAEKEQAVQALTGELAEIKGSRAWGVFQLIRRMRATLIPYGSGRERWARLVFDRFAVWGSKRFGRRSGSPGKAVPIQKNKTVRDLAKRWTDGKYLQLILDSVTQPYIAGIKMPGFPSEEVQRNFVGSSKENALREGYTFYQLIKRYCAQLGVPINAGTRILDFGCGWGRIARFFFKDVEGHNIFGVDVDPSMISFCASEMTCGRYATVHPEPPMEFLENNSLDVIFAYSVFSHLSEDVARQWIGEFARVLKPKGLLLATTQGRSFLDFCESLHDKQGELEHAWWKGLARSFLPMEKAKEDYDSGKFLFSPTGGGSYREKSFYGEAIISRQYVEREYARFLTLRDFVDDRGKLPQALFVMQKPG
jgi:SAM-dependent methyltransferase